MSRKKSTPKFYSVFAESIRDYIDLKVSTGLKFVQQSHTLRRFDCYCVESNVDSTTITGELVDNWLVTEQGGNNTRSHKIATIKGFAEYLTSIGVSEPWCPRPNYHRDATRYIPYIYNGEEITRIMNNSDNIPKPRGSSKFDLVFPAILKILYCCGLRVSEAVSLRIKDVDLVDGFIFIDKSKFDNSRNIPISESLLLTLREYKTANQELMGIDENDAFFPNGKGKPYSACTIYEAFRTVLWRSGIPHQGKGKGPRLHDLRHTFAVNALQRNVNAGSDMYAFLPVLMSYLGHSNIASTEYYLRLTAEVYPEFLEIANTVCEAVIPEVTDYEE